jgi:hypothetical protein
MPREAARFIATNGGKKFGRLGAVDLRLVQVGVDVAEWLSRG